VSEFQSTLQYLWGLKRLGTRPGPEVTAAVLHELGDPQRRFRSIHITGSKGKGSVAALCASMLRSAGLRTGLYTSPHLLSYRERARIDGEPASPTDLVEGIARVRGALDRLERTGGIDREATFFEVTTAWAFDLFGRKGVEAAAIEVGLGGRLDSTNVLEAPVTVVTTLELEHTELLGPTIQDIAREKAGIFHRNAWGVSGVEEGPGLEELRRHAFRAGVPLWELGREVQISGREGFERSGEPWQRLSVRTPARDHPGLEVPLAGAFQARNVAVAVAAVDLFARNLGRPIGEEEVRKGLAEAHWPGRMERLARRPPFYVDAAHTPGSAREVVGAIREIHPEWDPEESVLLFSCLADKRVEEILQELSPIARELVTFSLGSERALPGRDIARAARGCFPKVVVAPGVEEALRLARVSVGPHGVLVATGGVYLAGAVLSSVRGIPSEGPDLSDPVGRSVVSATAPVPSQAAPLAPRARGTPRPRSRTSRSPT
jgi:dihydrofolate synthase / folylpolyglutamate synthase